MGGAGASKPMVKPPRDWEPKGGKKSFEVISPCSDLSNPSDFNRVRYNRNSRQYQLSHTNCNNPGQTLSRNASKEKIDMDYNPHKLPVAVKVRRSTSTGGNSQGDIIAPGAFYFPTKESERQADYLAKKEARKNNGKIVFKRTDSNQMKSSRGKKGKMETFRSLSRKTAKKMKNKKDAMKRVALAVGHACLEESRNKMIQDRNLGLNASRQHRSATESETSRRNMDRKHSGSLRSRRRSEQVALGDLQSTNRREAPLSKFKKNGDSKMKSDKMIIHNQSTKNVERHQNQMDRVTAAALHQADAYFDRLSLSTGKNPGSSPFVGHGASNNRITSILESTSKKTPKGRTRRPSLDSPIDTPVSDLFSANDSLPSMQDNERLASSSKNLNTSPVSSLMLFYTKSGPMESTPKSYCSEGNDIHGKGFADEQSEESSLRRNIAKSSKQVIRRVESQESESSLYTTESKSHNKANGKYLKLLAHDGHQKHYDAHHSYVRAEQKEGKPRKKNTKHEPKQGMPKVSKLESLFRPIMPALSTDDAQSEHSYDHYEIKVTESAPGAIQAVALGFGRTTSQDANDASPSASVLSIDSQRERPSSARKSMVSNQARHNSEFLFTDDYGPVVVAKKAGNARDDGTISISTAASRSRLAQKYTQKGVSIPVKNLGKENDDVSFDSHGTKSDRRVRFSEGSFRTRLMKQRGQVLDNKEHPYDETGSVGKARVEIEERDDEETEVEEAPQASFAKNERPHTKYHKFAPNVKRVHSVDESIDLPEIESKMSNVSLSTNESSRKSLESARSVQSHHSISSSILEEDERTEMSRDVSIHWTKTETGVTPFVRGKSTANPTKSPYFRYKDAKTKFNTQNRVEPKIIPKKVKSPRKSPRRSPSKSPAKTLRKGSGGLVSMRIHELNTRVTEVRKLNRMRKKKTNPRLHTHNFDNTQPVRSRALINYKTNFGSADLQKSNNMMAAKFNMIPDVGDDDDDSTTFSPVNNHTLTVSSGKEYAEDDDVSRMSEVTGATFATVRQQRASIATVRQQRGSVATIQQQRGLAIYKQRDSSEISMASRTTASSGFTNVKKQVFRKSDGARSIQSTSNNTTLSTLIHNENTIASKKTILAPPTRGTPVMKWRTLAAAAAEKDSLKMSSTKKPRKKLGTRNMNVANQYEIYGFKD